MKRQIIRATVKAIPDLRPHLRGRARWIVVTAQEYKTVEYFERELERAVSNVYYGYLGGEFIDIMASMIYGQLEQAFRHAWLAEGGDGELPDYLTDAFEAMYLEQFDHVDQFYRDIVDARIDETSIDPLLARVSLWANRWNEAYNQAVALIAAEEGENMEWVLGETEEHCPECSALNGMVARASEWDALNVHPQGAPNEMLTCEGWRCDCSLVVTDKRRSPKAFDTILNIVSK
jgi:hypothetical protein